MNENLSKTFPSNYIGEFFRKAPEPMAITKVPDGTYVEINEAAEKQMGLPRHEIIGHSSLEIGHMTVAQRLMVFDEIREKGYAKNLELEMKVRNNETEYVLFNAYPIKFGEDEYLLSYITDVSRHRRNTAIWPYDVLFKSLDAIDGIGVILVRGKQKQNRSFYMNVEAKKILKKKPVTDLMDALKGHKSIYLSTGKGYYHVRVLSTSQRSPLQIIALEREADITLIREKLKHLDLTSRQEEIAFWASVGYSNREIAEKLCISEYTVKDHLKEIFHRIGVHKRIKLYPKIIGWR